MKAKSFPFIFSTIASVMLGACGGGSNNKDTTTQVNASSSTTTASSSSVVSAINIIPVFTGTGSAEAAEGSTATGYKAQANDQDGDALTYSLVEGADASHFTIAPKSGELQFQLISDFEKPVDADVNNLYELTVQASDGRGGIATQDVTVEIKNSHSLISGLSFSNDARQLTAIAECEGCLSQSLTFEWYVKGQDSAVSTGATYTMPIADRNKKIYLKATATDSNGSIETESLELMWNRAQEFSCYFLDHVGGCPIATMTDGTVIPFGHAENIQNVDLTDIERVYSNVNAFAGLKKDGTVVTWGNIEYGANSDSAELTDIVDITPGSAAFAALKSDGTVVVWGDASLGGDAGERDLSNVQKVYSNGRAFAALKKDGSVVTWGEPESGGDSSGADLTHVKKVYADSRAEEKRGTFAALKLNGSVVAWGNPDEGGEPGFDIQNVKEIFPNGFAYAALKEDGSVVTWGNPSAGGDSTDVNLTNIVKVISNRCAFAAVDANQNIIFWGGSWCGGDSSAVSLSNILDIIAIEDSFAAVTDSQVQSWGDAEGFKDLEGGTIFSGNAGYAILNKNGTVETWGAGYDARGSAEDVSNVLINSGGFTVHFTNGKVSGWGYYLRDSEVNKISNYVFDEISIINDWQWAGVSDEGEVLLWGEDHPSYGGDSLGDIDLEPGFVEISNSPKP